MADEAPDRMRVLALAVGDISQALVGLGLGVPRGQRERGGVQRVEVAQLGVARRVEPVRVDGIGKAFGATRPAGSK